MVQALVYLRIVMGLSVFSIAGNLLRIKLVNSLAGFQVCRGRPELTCLPATSTWGGRMTELHTRNSRH